MEKIKQPSVAGMFYTDDRETLLKQIEHFRNNSKKDYEYTARAVIVPHAGYEYSGQLAFNGIQYLNPNAKNIFIFAPPHRVAVERTAVSSYSEWATPIGNVPVNKEINKILIERFGSAYLDEAFAQEHSVEVQIPFLQNHLKNFNIIPILIGGENPSVIKDIIDYFYKDEDNAFVISSDLSHFHSSNKAKEIDNLTAEMIESASFQGFSHEQACGAMGVFALGAFAQEKNYSLIRVGLYNSGDVTGDNSRVVGYGSWLLYEGEKNRFIEKYFSKYTIDICRKSIQYALDTGKKMSAGQIEYVPEVFREQGACFVTLEIGHNLRGCIGSIIAHSPLIDDLVSNSYSAAFSDSRFRPLGKSEFEDVKINVSLLSTPTAMKFTDEADLLSQIVPYEDGIIIKDGYHQAVYLPSVWEQLPDKIEFLQSLKMKAGLSPDYFSKNFEAYRYGSVYIKED